MIALLLAACDSLDVDEKDAGPPDLTGRIVVDSAALARGDEFGTAVSVDGATMAIGAPGADVRGTDDLIIDNAGAVHVLELTDGAWSTVVQLTAPTPRRGDRFGASVSLQGGILVVGAPGDNTFGDGAGSAYVFEGSGAEWTPMQ
jgi:hypothetical protein